jgi:hypothetical protein
MIATEILTLTIDGKDVDVPIDRPFRLSARVAGEVVVAEALSMDEARERLERQYRETRDRIDPDVGGRRVSGDEPVQGRLT